MSYPFVRCLSIVTVFLGLSVTSQATTYNFTTIDVPGASTTEAHGINADGQIVGDFGGRHGFLYDPGAFTPFTTIDVPGASTTGAHGINAAGQIVGFFTDASGHTHGFLDTGGIFATIDVPDASLTIAYGINDVGQIVGSFQDASGHVHGFLDT